MGKTIFSCFAGRRRYLEILSDYIKHLYSFIDEVHIWDFTRDEEDAKWIHENWSCLEKFQIFSVTDKSNYAEYYQYYNKERYPENDTVLIKCDDDIVYIDVNKFESFIKERRNCYDAFLFTPCVINNPVCSAFIFSYSKDFKPNQEDVYFFSPEHAEFMHDSFLNGQIKETGNNFCRLVLNDYKFNINFVGFLSAHFDILSKIGKSNDEDEINSIKCPIVLNSHFFVSHMAYTKQREDGFDETNFLERYKQLRNKTLYDIK